jgi:hypothetical protein
VRQIRPDDRPSLDPQLTNDFAVLARLVQIKARILGELAQKAVSRNQHIHEPPSITGGAKEHNFFDPLIRTEVIGQRTGQIIGLRACNQGDPIALQVEFGQRGRYPRPATEHPSGADVEPKDLAKVRYMDALQRHAR